MFIYVYYGQADQFKAFIVFVTYIFHLEVDHLDVHVTWCDLCVVMSFLYRETDLKSHHLR